MASGVAVNEDVVTIFNEIKLKHANRYVIYGVSDNSKTIEVKTVGDTSKTYDDFLAELSDDICRYAVYDLQFSNKDGNREKLCFITWCPDTAAVKQKMLYASSKDALKKKLVGYAVEVQATDQSEISYESILDKASRCK